MKPSTTSTPGQELVVAIEANSPPERIAQTLADALAADQVHRDGTRGPDHKVRVQAAQILLSYLVGRPTERIETVNVNLDADSSIGLAERLRNSPALLKSLRAIIEQVEK